MANALSRRGEFLRPLLEKALQGKSGLTCFNCSKKVQEMRPHDTVRCVGCEFAFYCDEACQISDAGSHTSAECNSLIPFQQKIKEAGLAHVGKSINKSSLYLDSGLPLAPAPLQSKDPVQEIYEMREELNASTAKRLEKFNADKDAPVRWPFRNKKEMSNRATIAFFQTEIEHYNLSVRSYLQKILQNTHSREHERRTRIYFEIDKTYCWMQRQVVLFAKFPADTTELDVYFVHLNKKFGYVQQRIKEIYEISDFLQLFK